MKPIGGFLELEIFDGNLPFHHDALALYTARACFNLTLQHLKPSRVFIPYFTCNSVIEPLTANKIPYTFYGINSQFELSSNLSLGEGEYLLYINYWGLKNSYVEYLIKKYHSRLIVDSTQAFFVQRYPKNFSFNSARKIFGVPDGGYLYGPEPIPFDGERNAVFHYDHLIQRWLGNQQRSYELFVAYEKTLNCDLKRISLFSETILSGINYERAMNARINNFSRCHEAFEGINLFRFDWHRQEVPFIYPLLLDHELNKTKLYTSNIFLSVFWNDVLERHLPGFETDVFLTTHLVPLPIDHRYNEEHICFLIKTIKESIA